MAIRIPQPEQRREVGTVIKIESSSRPNHVHFVRLDGGESCSCEHFQHTRETCRHIRQARIRQAKATKVCRVCGGYGAFHWGTSKVDDCHHCHGTGKAA